MAAWCYHAQAAVSEVDVDWYRNKKILITGGSSGIGLAAALQAARSGASVGVVARRAQPLDEATGELRTLASGSDATIVSSVLDVSDRDAVRREVPRLVEQLGGLDVLINNAGISRVARFMETAEEAFEQVIRVNLFGSVWMTRAVLPHLEKQQRGTVAFVSSLGGILGVYGYSAYCTSKFALQGFADTMRQELVGSGVHVCVFCPGEVDTPMMRNEDLMMPSETRAVTGTLRRRPADETATDLLKAIANGDEEAIPGLLANASISAARMLPGVARWVTANKIRRARRR